MNRDDIIRMAKEAGWTSCANDIYPPLERFAALVAAAEKELIAQWVESWGNDLTITDGNGATRPLKYVTRDSGEG